MGEVMQAILVIIVPHMAGLFLSNTEIEYNSEINKPRKLIKVITFVVIKDFVGHLTEIFCRKL